MGWALAKHDRIVDLIDTAMERAQILVSVQCAFVGSLQDQKVLHQVLLAVADSAQVNRRDDFTVLLSERDSLFPPIECPSEYAVEPAA